MYESCCLGTKEAALSYMSSMYHIQDLQNAKSIGICKICTAPCSCSDTTHGHRHHYRHRHRHSDPPPPWVWGYGRRSVNYRGLQE